MSNPHTAPTPPPHEEDPDDMVTTEVNSETALDPEVVPAGGAGADSGATDTVQVDPEDEASVANRSRMNDEPGVGSRGPNGHNKAS